MAIPSQVEKIKFKKVFASQYAPFPLSRQHQAVLKSSKSYSQQKPLQVEKSLLSKEGIP